MPKTKNARALRDPLPKKLSALLQIALTDLEKVEKNKRYQINMGDWHYQEQKAGRRVVKPCSVCMAGSVLAMSLDIKPTETVEFWNRDTGNGNGVWTRNGATKQAYPRSVEKKLYAINNLREGDIVAAAKNVGLEIPADCPQQMPVYNYNYIGTDAEKIEFKADMAKLIYLLKAHGL